MKNIKTVPLNKRGKNSVLIFIKKESSLRYVGIHNKLKCIVFSIVILSVLFHLILELNCVTASKETIYAASMFLCFHDYTLDT